MERLRIFHRCGPGELTSDMARLPQFVTDLVAYLEARDCPVFVELVDKRFFVAIHIVNHLLCGGLGLDRVPMPVRNAVADFLTDEPSDQILLDYIPACRFPSPESIRALLTMLSTLLPASPVTLTRTPHFLTTHPPT